MRTSPNQPPPGVSQHSVAARSPGAGARHRLQGIDHAAVIGVVAMCAMILQEVIHSVAASPPLFLTSPLAAAPASSWGLVLVLAIWALALGFVLVLWLTHGQRENLESDAETRGSTAADATAGRDDVADDEDDGESQERPGMPGRWLIH